MKKKLFRFRVWGLLILVLILGSIHVSAEGWIDNQGNTTNYGGHYGKKVITALKLVDYDIDELDPEDNIGNRITAVEGDMTSNVLRFYVTQPCTLHITGMETLVEVDEDGDAEIVSDSDDPICKKIDISVEKKSGSVIKKGTVKWNMPSGEMRVDWGEKKNICMDVQIPAAGQYQIRVTSKVKNTKGICLHIVSVDKKTTSSATKAQKVTAKFNPNGGKVSKKSASFITGKKYGTLPKPTRKGYTFKGWYTAKKGGTLVNTKSTVKKSLTLYARWKKNTYKIKYDCGKGKNAKANPATYTVTSKKITLRKPTRKGYTFVGWYNTKGKRVKVIPSGSTGNITLKAKWKAVKHTKK